MTQFLQRHFVKDGVPPSGKRCHLQRDFRFRATTNAVPRTTASAPRSTASVIGSRWIAWLPRTMVSPLSSQITRYPR